MIAIDASNPRLIRVERPLLPDRYAVPAAAGRFTWDDSGRAVDPLICAAITRALSSHVAP